MERICKIAYFLAENEAPITIDTIADKLNVSNRTIRNDLMEVDKYLKNNGLFLSRKRGVGITIRGPEEKRLKLISNIELVSRKFEPFSPEDRENYILKKLFLKHGETTIKELMKGLYVSRSTIQKDLVNVKRWLKGFGLKLIKKSNSIIEVAGNEKNYRNAIASLVATNKEMSELKEMLPDNPIQRIDYDIMEKLKSIIDIDFIKLQKIVVNAEKALAFEFSYEAFVSLVIHIAISIKRLNEGNNIILSDKIMSELRNKDEYHVAVQIADDIYQDFKVKLPEQEIGYILLHILGAKLEQDNLDKVDIDLKDEADHELSVKVAKGIIHIAERALMMDFSNDECLLNGLILHLRPTINRLEYGLNIKNPILEQIKENYPDIYGVAYMTNTLFQQYLGKKINEDEVGYISMHLAAAVERQRGLIRTLVVCTTGIGSSQLLAAKLKKHFTQLDIKDVTSIVSLNNAELSNIDLVISTVPINATKPVLIISPLLTQSDIGRIINFINDLDKKDCGRFFMEDFIEINAGYSKKENVIKNMVERLFEKGFVKEGFEESVFDREKIDRTEVGKGVVVTHGFPEYVCMSQISVTVLKKPIKWERNKVDIIFLIALSKEDIKKSIDSLEGFYRAIDCDDFLNMLRQADSKSEIKEIIGKGC